MTLLITGGFGYVGSAILETIFSNEDYSQIRNEEIIVFDRLERQPGFFVFRKSKENFNNIKFILGDITDLNGEIGQKLKEAVERADRIIHLCSITQQPFSEDNNSIIVGGTESILSYARNSKDLKRIVNVSSTNTYGYFPGSDIICSEETLPNPVNFYSECKIKAEELCQQSFQDYNIPVINIRLSTNFGYADGIRLDFFLNNIIWNALYSSEVSVFGRRDNWRPFIHSKDAAQALLKICYSSEKYNGELYNVGSEDLNIRLDSIIEEVMTVVSRYRKDVPKFIFDSVIKLSNRLFGSIRLY